MFGTNVLRSQKEQLGLGDMLYVQSVFHTIQGEGPFAGRPAVFLRLAGCNLRCFFCDTDFESKRTHVRVRDVITEIASVQQLDRVSKATSLVVITGGEPLLQNILPLVAELFISYRYDVQIETAGTVWVEGLEKYINCGALTLVCSPKTGKVHPMIEEYCYDWKYLIREGEVSPGDGLPIKSTQVPGKDLKLFRPSRRSDTIWLQPCEAYKVGYQPLNPAASPGEAALDAPLADQMITSSARDEEQTQRNIKLCAELAMRYNYRVSLQLHKFLGLP